MLDPGFEVIGQENSKFRFCWGRPGSKVVCVLLAFAFAFLGKVLPGWIVCILKLLWVFHETEDCVSSCVRHLMHIANPVILMVQVLGPLPILSLDALLSSTISFIFCIAFFSFFSVMHFMWRVL